MQPIICVFMVVSAFRGIRGPSFTSSLTDFEALHGKSLMVKCQKIGVAATIQWNIRCNSAQLIYSSTISFYVSFMMLFWPNSFRFSVEEVTSAKSEQNL